MVDMSSIPNSKMANLNLVKNWNVSDVIKYLKNNSLDEFEVYISEKSIDGFKLLSLSEGLIAMWRPRVNARKLINAIDDLLLNPEIYLDYKEFNKLKRNSLADSFQNDQIPENTLPGKIKPKVPIRTDSLNNSVIKRKSIIENKNIVTIDEAQNEISKFSKDINLLALEAPKSFLYCKKLKMFETKGNPYTPMDVGMMGKDESENIDIRLKKHKKSSFPNLQIDFDEMLQIGDRGYYEMNSQNGRKSRRYSDGNVKYEENPYEELTFVTNDDNFVATTGKKKTGIFRRVLRRPTFMKENSPEKEENVLKFKKIQSDNLNDTSQKMYKINDRVVKKLQSVSNNYQIKPLENSESESKNALNFNEKYKKLLECDDRESKALSNCKIFDDNNYMIKSSDRVDHHNSFYEVPDISKNVSLGMNDFSCHFYETAETVEKSSPVDCFEEVLVDSVDDKMFSSVVIEDYLEPRKFFDVTPEAVMDNLADEIMKLFDAGMGKRQTQKDIHQTTSHLEDDELTSQFFSDFTLPLDTNQNTHSTKKPPISKKPSIPQPLPRLFRQNAASSSSPKSDAASHSNDRPFETLHKWNETLRNSIKKKKDTVRKSMAERPLPVPVENEFYYMEVGRGEAETLLEGHADGTFILRPSSQSTHAYTLTLIFEERIYNIGCRRRQDGRLALGFFKAGEKSFQTIHELIEHYYTEKLVLLVDNCRVGKTVLRKLNA